MDTPPEEYIFCARQIKEDMETHVFPGALNKFKNKSNVANYFTFVVL